MGLAARRPADRLDPVREEDRPDPVAARRRRERDGGRGFRGEIALGRQPRAEIVRGREIDEEEQRAVSLLAEDLDERLARARRDVPIDRPDVVARPVFAHFGKFHSTPVKNGPVVARGQGVGFLSRGD